MAGRAYRRRRHRVAFERPDARRRDQIRRDAVDADPHRAELEGQRPAELRHRRLLSGVDGEARGSAMRLDRREVDDGPTVGWHQRYEGAHEQGDAVEVLTHQGVLALGVHGQEVAAEATTGVVDQDVDMTEPVTNRGRIGVDVVGLSYVELGGQ